MGSDSESDSRRSSIEEEEGAGGGMQEHDHVMSPKEEMMAHTDYEYTGPKKFIHEKIFSLPPDKWKRGFWDIHVCQTCYKQPGYYFAGCCCTCCFVFYQRKALLGDRMATEYSCCQGAYGKCWCTPCARMCPHLCLLVESFCCTSCGVSGNRKEMMNIYPTQNTWGECCLLWTATILSFFGYFAACITILVNGCLNSQQENEWVKHEKKTGLMPYCSWGDKGAHLCNCPANKCQPCCGDPCSVGDGLYCCLCWTFGCLCSSSKLLAWGADQNCAVVNHFGAYLGAVLFILFGGGLVGALASFFPCILPIVPCAVYFPLATLNGISRHNVRSKAEIGRNQDWFGDCILANLPCTYCCSMCQMCRVVPKESWDWLAQVREHGLTMMETEFKYFPDQEIYVPGRDVEWENQPIPPLLPCLAKEEGEEDEEDEDGEKKEKKKDKKKDKKEKKEVKEESKEVKEDKKDKSASASEASGAESESEKSSASVKSASEKKSGSGSGSGSASESESAKSAKKSSSSSSDEGSDEGSDSGSDESGSEESD